MKRTLVFGDIHGGLKALIQLLERIDYSENDRFVFWEIMSTAGANPNN